MTTEQMPTNIFEDIPCLRPHADKIYERVIGSRPEKGVMALRDRFEDFAQWAREVEREAERDGHPRTVLQMPIEPRDLAAYAEWLDSERVLAVSSISSYMSALGALHIAAGFLPPTTSTEVKDVLAKLRDKRSEADLQRARALSDAELARIFDVLYLRRRTVGRRIERPEEARKRADFDKALLATMIQAGMRRSEAADLTWGKVVWLEDGTGAILLPDNWPRSGGYYAVRVTAECMDALREIKPEDATPGASVFNLSGSQINRRLKRMCEEAGIDPKDISGHTTRATLQRLMVDNGAPVDAVKAQLRLKPPAIPAMYIHIEDEQDLGRMEKGTFLKDVKHTVGYIDLGIPRHHEVSVNSALCRILQRMMHGCSVRPEPVRGIYGHPRLRPDILITEPGGAHVIMEAEVDPAHGVEADALARLGLKAAVDRRDIEAVIALRYPANIATADDLDAKLVVAKLRYCAFLGGKAGVHARLPESGWLESSASDIAEFARLVSLPPSKRRVMLLREFIRRVRACGSRIDETTKLSPAVTMGIA